MTPAEEMAARTSRAVLWYGLALLWALDAALALTPNLALDQIDMVLMGGFGQPAWYLQFVSNTVYYWVYHAHVAGLLVAVEFSVQAAIALMLALFRGRRLGRSGLWLSIGWALLVWVMAEWMGGLWAGMSFWTGAPGSAVLYIFAAVMLLRPAGGPGHLRRALGCWWLLGALLQAAPAWWRRHTLSTAIRANLVVTPSSWRTLPIQWLVHQAASHPAAVNAALAAAMLAVGASSLLGRSPWAVAPAGAWALLLWWWGENLGGLLGGIATDPNTGPLWLLLAVSAWWPVGKRAPRAPASLEKPMSP